LRGVTYRKACYKAGWRVMQTASAPREAWGFLRVKASSAQAQAMLLAFSRLLETSARVGAALVRPWQLPSTARSRSYRRAILNPTADLCSLCLVEHRLTALGSYGALRLSWPDQRQLPISFKEDPCLAERGCTREDSGLASPNVPHHPSRSPCDSEDRACHLRRP